MKKLTEFLCFIFYGAIAALVTILARWLLNHALPYELSIVLGNILGMMVAFISFKTRIFTNSQNDLYILIVRYILVNCFGLCVTVGISMLLAYIIFPALNMKFYPYDVAHIVGVSATAVTSYFGHKYFTFS